MCEVADRSQALTPFFVASLSCLAIAAVTGALLRGGLALGWDLGLPLGNLRHAHSHLMLFGWATPALMLLMAHAQAGRRGGRVPRSVGHVLGAALLLAIVTHLLFSRFGYAPVAVSDARVPLAAVASGLVVLTWYAFAAQWWRGRGEAPRGTAWLAWDLALGVLLVASLATWALPALRPLGLDAARWTPILVHAFLDPFSEGWLVLAVLGLAHAARGTDAGGGGALVALALLAPLAAPLGVPRALVPDAVRAVASVAAVGWGAALLIQVAALARGAPAGWAAPLALGGAAAVAKIVAGATPWVAWSGLHGLRVLYLHALMFGFVTLGVLVAARGALGARAVVGHGAMRIGVVALLATLVPLSELWPAGAGGAWAPRAATAVACAVAGIAVVGVAGSALLTRRERAPSPSTACAPPRRGSGARS